MIIYMYTLGMQNFETWGLHIGSASNDLGTVYHIQTSSDAYNKSDAFEG